MTIASPMPRSSKMKICSALKARDKRADPKRRRALHFNLRRPESIRIKTIARSGRDEAPPQSNVKGFRIPLANAKGMGMGGAPSITQGRKMAAAKVLAVSRDEPIMRTLEVILAI